MSKSESEENISTACTPNVRENNIACAPNALDGKVLHSYQSNVMRFHIVSHGSTRFHMVSHGITWYHMIRRDYFFFLYTWSAHPPYQIMHISHAFIPYDAEDHKGVYFPTGLQLLPRPNGYRKNDDQPSDNAPGLPSLMFSYGKDDSLAHAMTLSGEAVREYLQPIDGLDPQQYKFCTIGKDIIKV